jgi:hypothetical protein
VGYLDLRADRKRAKEAVEPIFTSVQLRNLVKEEYEPLDAEILWEQPRSNLVSDVIDEANRHGVLDRLLIAAAAERDFFVPLRAVILHLSAQPGWTVPVESHGLDVKSGLEQLTSRGDPFLGTTLMADFLTRTERQVCRVRCGEDLGTGFLVGPDLVLTCYHVVQKYLADSTRSVPVQVQFDFRADAKGEVPPQLPAAWLPIDTSWSVPNAPYSSNDVTLNGEPGSDELDYALLKLPAKLGLEPPTNEPVARGWVDVSTDASLPTVGDPITIVQHPEVPESRPITQQPLKFTQASPGYDGVSLSGTRVKYKPSTLPGSSGSPVYDRSFRAFALHHNRGQIDPKAVDLYTNNRGIPLARIRAHLAPDIRKLLLAAP